MKKIKQTIKNIFKKLPILRQASARWNFLVNKIDSINSQLAVLREQNQKLIDVANTKKMGLIQNEIIYHSDNELLKNIWLIGSKFDEEKTHIVIKKFFEKLSVINDLLYQKLNAEDKNIFVLFFIMRYGNIKIIEDNEKIYIESLFQKAQELLQARNSIEDYITIDFLGKSVKYITKKTLKNKELTDGNLLMSCYDIVHAFYLNEYYLENFYPQNESIILDCGAAQGDTALAFSIQYNAEVHSFECVDENFSFLQKVIPVKTFLYSKTGEFEIEGKIEKTLSIDDYVNSCKLKNIGMIKFDIEGAEQEALKGAIHTIKTQKPILAIPIYHLESDLYEIPKFLHELNMPMEFGLKWVEKKVLGVDCVLFVKFIERNCQSSPPLKNSQKIFEGLYS